VRGVSVQEQRCERPPPLATCQHRACIERTAIDPRRRISAPPKHGEDRNGPEQRRDEIHFPRRPRIHDRRRRPTQSFAIVRRKMIAGHGGSLSLDQQVKSFRGLDQPIRMSQREHDEPVFCRDGFRRIPPRLDDILCERFRSCGQKVERWHEHTHSHCGVFFHHGTDQTAGEAASVL
jgi:hypothetical protein